MRRTGQRTVMVATVAVALMAGGGCGGGGGGTPRGGPAGGGGTPARAGDGGSGSGSAPGGREGSASGGSAVATPAAQDAELRRLTVLGLPIYCAGQRGNLVALTFDDGPGPYTPLALRKLHKHGVRGTFFLVGNVLARGPSMPRRERREGAVGDHTVSHPLLPSLDPARVREQMAGAQSAVAAASGGPVRLFRPPYGARTPAIDAQAKALGMLEVLWNVDSRDSLGANYAAIADNVRNGLRPGAIILMHENRGQTIRAMLAIFPELARRHLRAVTVPELLAADPPSEAQVRRGPQGCPGTSAASRASG